MPIYFGISVLVTGYILSLSWFNHYQGLCWIIKLVGERNCAYYDLYCRAK